MAIRDRDQALEDFFAAKRSGGGNIFGGPPQAPPPQPKAAPAPAGEGGGYWINQMADRKQKKENESGLNPFDVGIGTSLKNGLGTVLGGAAEKLDWVGNLGPLAVEEFSEWASGEELKTQTNADGTLNEFGKQGNWEKLSDPDYGVGKMMGDFFGDPEESEWASWGNRALGFVGDVALDPTMYLGGGAVKSANAVGQSGRRALAQTAARKGLSDDIVRQVAQYGPAYLDDATRKVLNVKDAGIYWGVGAASVKIPGTSKLGRGIERSFTQFRDKTWTNATMWKKARGDAALASARKAASTGRTVDQYTPELAAKFLNNVDVRASKTAKYRDIYASEAQSMTARWTARIDRSILKEVESGGRLSPQAQQWVAFRDKLYKFAVDNNVKVGFLGEQYVPHRLTREGLQAVRQRPQLSEVLDMTSGQAMTSKRGILPDQGPQMFDDVLIDFGPATIESMEAALQKAFPGVNKKWMEDSASRVMERYIDEVAQSVATVDMFKAMVTSGDIGGVKAFSTEMVESAANATRNADFAKLLRRELAQRDKVAAGMQEEAWDLSQQVAKSLHESLDAEFKAAGNASKGLRKDIKAIRKDIDDDAPNEALKAKFAGLKKRTEDGYQSTVRRLDEVSDELNVLDMSLRHGDYGSGINAQRNAAAVRSQAKRVQALEHKRAIIEEQLLELDKARKLVDKLESAVGVRVSAQEQMAEFAGSPDGLREFAEQLAADDIIKVTRPIRQPSEKTARVLELENKIKAAEEQALNVDEAMNLARRGENEAAADALDAATNVELGKREVWKTERAEVQKRADEWDAQTAATFKKDRVPVNPTVLQELKSEQRRLIGARNAQSAKSKAANKARIQIQNVEQRKAAVERLRDLPPVKAKDIPGDGSGRLAIPEDGPIPRIGVGGRKAEDFVSPKMFNEYANELTQEAAAYTRNLKVQTEVARMERLLLDAEDSLSAASKQMFSGQAAPGSARQAMIERAADAMNEIRELTTQIEVGRRMIDDQWANPHSKVLANFDTMLDESYKKIIVPNRAASRAMRDEWIENPAERAKQLKAVLVDVEKLEQQFMMSGRIQGWEEVDKAVPRTIDRNINEILEEIDKTTIDLEAAMAEGAAVKRLPLYMEDLAGTGKRPAHLAPVADEEADVIREMLLAAQKGRFDAKARFNNAKYEFKKLRDGLKEDPDELLKVGRSSGQPLSDIDAEIAALKTKRSKSGSLTKEDHERLEELTSAEAVNARRTPGDSDTDGLNIWRENEMDDLTDYQNRYIDVAERGDPNSNGRIIKSSLDGEHLEREADRLLGQVEEDAARAAQRKLDRVDGVDSGNSPFASSNNKMSVDEYISESSMNMDDNNIMRAKRVMDEAEYEAKAATAAYKSALRSFGLTEADILAAAPGGVLGDVLLYVPDVKAKLAAIRARTGKEKANIPWIKEGVFETPEGLRQNVRARFNDDWEAAKKAFPVESSIGRSGKKPQGFDDLLHTQAAIMDGGASELRRYGKAKYNALPDSMKASNTSSQLKQVLRFMPPSMRRRLWSEASQLSRMKLDRTGTVVRALEKRLDDLSKDFLDQQSAMPAYEKVLEQGRAGVRERLQPLRDAQKVEADLAASVDRNVRNLSKSEKANSQAFADEAARSLGFEEIGRVAKEADEASRLSGWTTENVFGDQADRWKALEKQIGKREAAETAKFDAARSVKQAMVDDAPKFEAELAARQAAVKDAKERLNLKYKTGKSKEMRNVKDEDLASRLDEFGALLDEAKANPNSLELQATVRLYDDWMKLSAKQDRYRQGTDGLMDVFDAAQLGAKGKAGGLALDMQRGFVDGFTQLRSTIYPAVDGAPIDTELNRLMTNFLKVTQDDMSLKYFDEATRFFKSYATATPGFHLRNFMGASFMNFSDGVSIKNSRDAMRLWRSYSKDRENFLSTQPKEVVDAFEAVFGSGAGGRYSGGEIGTGLNRAKNKAMNNSFLRKSRKIGEDMVEGPVRLAAALDATRNGADMSAAMSRVSRLHFNYADLSKMDRVLKKGIPFYMFMSRNLPLQVEQMWRKPKAYVAYNHFMNNISIEGEADEYMPQWMKDAGGVVIGRNGIFGSGKDTVLMPDFQHTGLMDDVMSFAGGNGRIPILDGLLSAGNPLVTKPIEMLTNRSGFKGGDLFYDNKKNQFGTPVEKTAADKWRENAVYALESIFTSAGTAQGLGGFDLMGGEASARNKDRMAQKVLNTLGFNFKQLGADERRSEALRRQFED